MSSLGGCQLRRTEVFEAAMPEKPFGGLLGARTQNAKIFQHVRQVRQHKVQAKISSND